MTRTKRFLDGVFFTYANQIVVMAVGLWLTPFLLVHLGRHDYGLWLIGLQALNYLGLLDLGVIGLLPREVAYVKGRAEGEIAMSELRNLLEETVTVLLWQMPLLVAAALVAWYMLPVRNGPLASAVALVLAVFVAQFPIRIFAAALEGLQEFKFLGSLQFASWAAGLVVNIMMILVGEGLLGLALGWAATQLVIAAGSAYKFYSQYASGAPRRIPRLPVKRVVHYLGAGWWISLGQLAHMFKSSDMLLVGRISGANAVAPYSCSVKLVAVLSNQPQVLMQAAQPGLSEMTVGPDRQHLSKVVGALSQAMLMMSGCVGCLVLAINQAFVTRWVGPEFYLGFWFTAFSILALLIRHWNVTIVYTLFCFGHQRHLSLVTMADGLATVGASIFCVRWFGPSGIPLGSIAGLLLISLPLNLRLLKREMGGSLAGFSTPILKWLGPYAVASVAIVALAHFYVPTTYLGIAALSVLSVAIYGVVELRTAFESRWGGYLRSRFDVLRCRFMKSAPAEIGG